MCDPTGRVRGSERIVVGDVALMPQVLRENTNIPAIVVSEHVAAMLLG